MVYNELLDISALKRALTAYENMLKRALFVEKKPVETLEFYEFESVQAGLIQHFEFSFELSWKFMERYFIREGMPSGMMRKQLFREAIKVGLIAGFEDWVKFNHARNRTSHTYDSVTAEAVYRIAKSYYPVFEAFVKTMESRI